MQTITGQIVSVFEQRIFPGIVSIENGKIARIDPLLPVSLDGDEAVPAPYFILPGFIDAHVHVESSMLVPSEFARLAVVHGTVGTVSDPHEIANVCGIEGVEFMIDDGNTVPFKFNFGAPSCVPATSFETAGAELGVQDVDRLLQRQDIRYLSEMMNFPGVLQQDESVMAKIAAAKRLGKPVDGHAPGLRGSNARDYIQAGISTDHECFTREEAEEKLRYGMKVIIREGSAARNFDALIDLLHDHSESIMFCSDDKHPDSLVEGHINALCARAVDKGVDIFKILRAACINPVLHYGLDIGLLREGDPADLIVVENLKDFKVLQTFINGELVSENGRSTINRNKWETTGHQQTGVSGIPRPINRFECEQKQIAAFETPVSAASKTTMMPVIEALDGQLITNRLNCVPAMLQGHLVSDPERDILKIVVVNRYRPAPVAWAFIKNFGLQQGAIASSVAHDSHNIVAVGADDESICRAVNLVIEQQGGISCVRSLAPGIRDARSGADERVLALPVAGLMSSEDGYQVAKEYTALDAMAKELGSSLRSPFMTLSFMALLVIPHLKLSDRGLFDGDAFCLLESPA